MSKNSTLHRLTQSGMIAALYAVLTLILPIASFGPLQLRFSEVLTVLPVFTPTAVPGLTLGCAIANAIGVATGANIAGVWDILIGSAATFLAAVCTRATRNCRLWSMPILSVLFPVLFNAVIIGGELCLVTVGEWSTEVFALNALQVALGQLVPCVVGGLILCRTFEKSGISSKIFRNS